MSKFPSVASRLLAVGALFLAGYITNASADHNEHHSSMFQGVKANTGTVTHSTEGGHSVLTLSDDFKVPDAPAPHWQVVDSHGNTYLLQRLVIKGDKLNKSITVPAYVKDVTKVQIWCAWAETLLGEAQVAEKKSLTLEGAKRVIAAAEAEARRLNAPGAVIAVVDDGGNLMALERLDNTFAAGALISYGKARTSAIFKRPTAVFEKIIREGRTPMGALNDFTPLQGGVPIEMNGQIVG